ncbi:hypothetical protein ACIA5C_02615 [Actinoplanes sp. NPDC051343]|uniref:hypothetical protein n=1 Tax=Actinoplanes sp. NPDC051343 TaxID=3363906 RepID=UPI00378C87B5
MHTKRFVAGATAGVATLALIGACAQQVERLEPGLELRAAAQHLAAEKQAGFTLKVTGSADDLIAAMKAQAAKDKSDDGPWTDDDTSSLRKVLNSSVTVAYDQAGPGADDDRMRLAATVDGVEGTELRVVDKMLYVKAPVDELAQKFGAAAGDVSSARKGATEDSPAFGAFFDGGWVSFDTKDAAGLPATAFGVPTGKTDNAKTLAELKSSASNLFKGAQITRDAADPRHLVVTSSTAKAYTELKRLVTTVSGAQAKEMSDAFDKAPKDRPIVVDVWVDHEKLTALELNLLQFVDGATGRVALRIDATTGEPIDAPQGATKIDSAALSGLTGNLAGGSAGPADLPGGAGDAPSATDTAEAVGFAAIGQAAEEKGKPADYLPAAIANMPPSFGKVRIVRHGVAEVTVKGAKACVKVPASVGKEPKVTKGAC